MLKSFRSSILLQLESLNFWEFLVLSRWRNIRIQAPRIQNPACFHFTLFKLPDPGANIYVQRLLKFPHVGCARTFKVPTSSRGHPLGRNIDSCINSSLQKCGSTGASFLYRYVKTQPNTIELSKRLRGINHTNFVVIPQSLVLRT